MLSELHLNPADICRLVQSSFLAPSKWLLTPTDPNHYLIIDRASIWRIYHQEHFCERCSYTAEGTTNSADCQSHSHFSRLCSLSWLDIRSWMAQELHRRIGDDESQYRPLFCRGTGWFHPRTEKYRQKNEDRLNYLAKEISLNAPHRTIKANTRPSERQRPKIFIMGNLVHESNGKLMRIHRVQTTGWFC